MNEIRLKTPVRASDHYKGALQAPLIVVEYGDFQCPFSAAAAPVMDRLIFEFETDLCFVYRHFPLRNLHPFAEMAALAAEAAAEQGSFWLMQHLLFENSNSLSPKMISILAEELGLNMNRFRRDLRRQDLLQKVINDFHSGVQSHVDGTPTFYINDIRFEGTPHHDQLRQTLLDILSAKEGPSENLIF